MTMPIKRQLEMFTDPTTGSLAPKYLANCRNRLAARGVLTTRDVCEVAQSMMAHHLLTTGIKIIKVSDAEAELYAHTDLSGIDPREWRQSYPAILVLIGDDLTGVLHLSELTLENVGPLFPVNILCYPRPGIVDHAFVSHDIEEAFKNYYSPIRRGLVAEHVCELDTERGRIACNAVLHLCNYPELYGRHPDANNKVVVRKENAGKVKRCDLVPQIIRLRAAFDEQNKIYTGPRITSAEGHTKKPHWRRGHWRQAAVGVGRAERRRIFIKPILIHGDDVIGDKAGMSLFVA